MLGPSAFAKRLVLTKQPNIGILASLGILGIPTRSNVFGQPGGVRYHAIARIGWHGKPKIAGGWMVLGWGVSAERLTFLVAAMQCGVGSVWLLLR